MARWDTGCSFVDYDLDGRLDLIVTSYLEFDRAKIPEPGAGGYCQWKGIPVMCGPRGLPFARNRLFHNDGNGRFTDVSATSGVGGTKGCYAFTVVASDFDNDRLPRSVRRLRLDAKPAVPKQEGRHVRGRRAARRAPP